MESACARRTCTRICVLFPRCHVTLFSFFFFWSSSFYSVLVGRGEPYMTGTYSTLFIVQLASTPTLQVQEGSVVPMGVPVPLPN